MITVQVRDVYHNSLEQVGIELGGKIFIIYEYPNLLTTDDLVQKFYIEIIGTDEAWEGRYKTRAKAGLTSLYNKLKTVCRTYNIETLGRVEKLIGRRTYSSIGIWFKLPTMDRSRGYTTFRDFIKQELEKK